MKKLAQWLNKHAICLGDSLKANVLHLWCILILAVLVTLFAALGWRGDAMYYLLMVLLSVNLLMIGYKIGEVLVNGEVSPQQILRVGALLHKVLVAVKS